MKTGEGLARHAEMILAEKWLYAWGTYGQRLRDEYATLAAGYYYRIKNPAGLMLLKALLDKGENPHLVDCHGIKDGYMMTDDAGVLRPVAGMDTSADADFNYVQAHGVQGVDWGIIGTIPAAQRGLGVRKPGHFGVCVGDGYSIDIWATASPARKRLISANNWTHWYRCQGIDYALEVQDVIQKGEKGTGIARSWQETLLKLEFSVGPDGADDWFGSDTETATKDFQAHYSLPQTGIVDAATATKAMDALRLLPGDVSGYQKQIENYKAQIATMQEQYAGLNLVNGTQLQELKSVAAALEALSAVGVKY